MLKPFHPTELRIRIRNLILFSHEHKAWLKSYTGDKNTDKILNPGDQFVESAKTFVLKRLADSNYGVIDLAEATASNQRSLARKIIAHFSLLMKLECKRRVKC